MTSDCPNGLAPSGRVAPCCKHETRRKAHLRESIALAQLKGLLADGVQLVDVLPPEEYAAEHLPGAVNVPLKRKPHSP
jgi:hypothetical protein